MTDATRWRARVHAALGSVQLAVSPFPALPLTRVVMRSFSKGQNVQTVSGYWPNPVRNLVNGGR